MPLSFLRSQAMLVLRCLLPAVVVITFASTAAAQQPATVTVAPIEKKPITIASRLVATTEPMMRSTVAAEQSALVRERVFDEGQEVQMGALLARFDDSLLLRRLASADAALRSALAELERARLVEENSHRERERITSLYEQNVATEKEYFDAMNEHERAQASVSIEEARVAEREAAADELKLQIEKMRVLAPFAGVINRRYVEVGQWVREGDPVAEIVQLDPLYVRTGVPESVLSRLKSGDRARVAVDALGGREIEAVIAEILPVADPESRTFPVRLRVENPEHTLRPGMFARVTFSQSNDAWLVVPKDAVTRFRGQTIVVVAEKGVARSVPVELGATDETSVAIAGEGLKEGDLVVIRGNEGLMDGTPLMIANTSGRQGGPPGGPPGGGPPGEDQQGQRGQGRDEQKGGPPDGAN